MMQIGVIADDFTGASDIANTLAKGIGPEGGLRTAQFAGVPKAPAPDDIEAGIVSLKSRTAPIDQAISESLAAVRWLQEQGCRQFVFKYCSTFDSTRQGNIGPVAEALADHLNAEKVIFCPAFPATGRTIYQGHLFVGGKLLNESGLENHPLTPMADANIQRWLQHQTRETVGLLPWAVVDAGSAAIRQSLSDAPERFLIADAISDGDLLKLGEALADATLITGGSGIALGLPRNLMRTSRRRTSPTRFEGLQGPEAILAGSCSGATRQQIEIHAQDHPAMQIDVTAVMDGRLTAGTLVSFIRGHQGKAPLVYSSGAPDKVRAIQERFGREAVAAKLDALYAETAQMLVDGGYRRLVVAGGETSGAVAQALAGVLLAPAMTIGPEIDPGVPILRLGEEKPVLLALKSGNFGGPGFFAKALQIMENGP